jgi:hypothetical protein
MRNVNETTMCVVDGSFVKERSTYKDFGPERVTFSLRFPHSFPRGRGNEV